MKKLIVILMILAMAFSTTLFACDNKNNDNTNSQQSGQSSGSTTNTIKVSSITLNIQAITLTVGSDVTLKATIAPTNATNKNVLFNSDNSTIATVDSTGKVLAKSVGTTTVTVVSADGNAQATCQVTVKEGSGVELPDVKL